MTQTTFQQSMAYLDWCWINAAALTFYLRNADPRRPGGHGDLVFAANSDAWSTTKTGRQELRRMLRELWRGFSGRSYLEFPYNTDACIKLYVRFRRRTPEELAGFRTQIIARMEELGWAYKEGALTIPDPLLIPWPDRSGGEE